MKVIDVYKQYFEAEFLPKMQEYADSLVLEMKGAILWDKPLREAMYG